MILILKKIGPTHISLKHNINGNFQPVPYIPNVSSAQSMANMTAAAYFGNKVCNRPKYSQSSRILVLLINYPNV